MARVPQKSTRAWDRSSRPGPPTIGEGVSRPTHRCRLRSPLTIRQGYRAMSGQTRARISALTKSPAPQLALVHSPVLVPANKTLAAAARRARHSSSVLDPFERLHGRHAVARLVRAATQRNDMFAFEHLFFGGPQPLKNPIVAGRAGRWPPPIPQQRRRGRWPCAPWARSRSRRRPRAEK